MVLSYIYGIYGLVKDYSISLGKRLFWSIPATRISSSLQLKNTRQRWPPPQNRWVKSFWPHAFPYFDCNKLWTSFSIAWIFFLRLLECYVFLTNPCNLFSNVVRYELFIAETAIFYHSVKLHHMWSLSVWYNISKKCDKLSLVMCNYCNNRNGWSPLFPIYWLVIFFMCLYLWINWRCHGAAQCCTLQHLYFNGDVTFADWHGVPKPYWQSSFIIFNFDDMHELSGFILLLPLLTLLWVQVISAQIHIIFFPIWILDSQMPPKWLDSTKTSHSCDDQNVTKIKHFEIACSPLFSRQVYTN